MESSMIMGKDTSGTRRPRRKPGEPRTCAWAGCGLELDESNSFKGSYYCKPHHQAKTLASRDREANIERVKRYNAAHPEVVKRNKEKSAERRAQGLPPHPTRGRPPREPRPAPAPAQLLERCARPPSSRRWHVYDERGISLCGQWVADPAGPFEPRPADAGDLCAGCRRAAVPPKA